MIYITTLLSFNFQQKSRLLLLIVLLNGLLLPAKLQANENSQIGQNANINVDRLDEIVALYSPGSVDQQGLSQVEKKLLQLFAEENNVQLKWKEIPENWNLLSSLINGEGNLIVGQDAGLIAGMDTGFNLNSPWSSSAPLLVVRKDTTHIIELKDLHSRQIALKESSNLWQMFSEMAEKHIGMSLVKIPESMTAEEILQKIDSGEYDVSVLDSLYLRTAIHQYPNLSISLGLSEPRNMVWITGKGSNVLSEKLDDFLETSATRLQQEEVSTEDLPVMKSKNILRLITYQSPTNLYFETGRLSGFEYDLIHRFANDHKMKVNLVLATSHEEMQEMLINGEGDVIAASLPIDSISNENLSATAPYLYASPIIVGRDGDEPVIDITDLEGHRITLPLESPYRDLLQDIKQKQGIDFELVDAEANMNTESTLNMVAGGMYDLTVIPGHLAKSEMARQEGLKVHFSLTTPEPFSWFVRKDDRLLIDSLNQYIAKTYRTDHYWTLHRKYIAQPRVVREESRLISVVKELSPYDELLKNAAKEYDFDWRLIAAQMYQESQFDPEAVSYAGAEGLMQIMPATAQDLGLEHSKDPEESIRAGVRYMHELRQSFSHEMLPEQKSWFSLAAYNAGLGRIYKAQDRAESMGLNPDIWFGNVETALLEMAQASICRCGQTIIYVREIRSIYNNYLKLLEASSYITSRPHNNVDHDS